MLLPLAEPWLQAREAVRTIQAADGRDGVRVREAAEIQWAMAEHVRPQPPSTSRCPRSRWTRCIRPPSTSRRPCRITRTGLRRSPRRTPALLRNPGGEAHRSSRAPVLARPVVRSHSALPNLGRRSTCLILMTTIRCFRVRAGSAGREEKVALRILRVPAGRGVGEPLPNLPPPQPGIAGPMALSALEHGTLLRRCRPGLGRWYLDNRGLIEQ